MIGVLLGCFLIGTLLVSSVVGACCYFSYFSKITEERDKNTYLVNDYPALESYILFREKGSDS